MLNSIICLSPNADVVSCLVFILVYCTLLFFAAHNLLHSAQDLDGKYFFLHVWTFLVVTECFLHVRCNMFRKETRVWKHSQ